MEKSTYCAYCRKLITDVAFPITSQMKKYSPIEIVGYCCSTCHPNKQLHFKLWKIGTLPKPKRRRK